MSKEKWTVDEVLDQIETTRALTFALIAAIEVPLYTDDDDDDAPVTGSQHFVIDQKALLAIFGEKLHEQFSLLSDFVKDGMANNKNR